MEENKTQEVQEENKIDSNTKEIIKKANAERNLSDAEKKALIQKINEDFNFRKMINEISLSHDLKLDKYVIFTNGKEQLYYENGEFFLISTIDSKEAKKKIKREEARNLYNEYYMVTVLNPLLKQKNKGIKLTKVQAEKAIISNDNSTNSNANASDSTVKEKEEEIKTQIKHSKFNDIKSQVNSVDETEKSDKDELEDIQEKLKELKEKEKKIKEKRKENEAREK